MGSSLSYEFVAHARPLGLLLAKLPVVAIQRRPPVVTDLAVNDLFFAPGQGCHEIVVVPHPDLMVAATAENPAHTTLSFLALSESFPPSRKRQRRPG